MTNRELYLRCELGFFRDQLESARDLKRLSAKKREHLMISPERMAARFAAILDRAFVEWDDCCNDNLKSMYFCSKKKRHRGRHGTDGLAWD